MLSRAARFPRSRQGLTTFACRGNGQFEPLSLTMTSTDSGTKITSRRGIDIRSWSDGDRTIRARPGPTSLLWMHENMNPGWEAKLNGLRLTPTVVDGWQQGFEVPSGEGGDVKITFAPQSSYFAALVLGWALRSSSWSWRAWRSCRRSPAGGTAGLQPRRRLPALWRRVAVGLAVPVAWLLAGPAVAIGLVSGVLVPSAIGVFVRSSEWLRGRWSSCSRHWAPPSPRSSVAPHSRSWASLLAGLGVGVLLAAALDPGPRTIEIGARS